MFSHCCFSLSSLPFAFFSLAPATYLSPTLPYLRSYPAVPLSIRSSLSASLTLPGRDEELPKQRPTADSGGYSSMRYAHMRPSFRSPPHGCFVVHKHPRRRYRRIGARCNAGVGARPTSKAPLFGTEIFSRGYVFIKLGGFVVYAPSRTWCLPFQVFGRSNRGMPEG